MPKKKKNKNTKGNTPTAPQMHPRLSKAISANDADLVKQVVEEEKLNVNEGFPPNNHTALHFAAMTNKAKAGQALIDLGADINARSQSQLEFLTDVTPLHTAALIGHVAFIHMLAENKADLDSFDGSGFTPLQSTTQYGKIKAAEALIQHKANPLLQNKKNGRTAFQLAIEENEPEMAMMLQQAEIEYRKNQSSMGSTAAIANQLSVQLNLSESKGNETQSTNSQPSTHQSSTLPSSTSSSNAVNDKSLEGGDRGARLS